MQSQLISSGRGDIAWLEKQQLLIVVGEDLMAKMFSLEQDGKVVSRDFSNLDGEMYAVHATRDRVIIGGDSNNALEAVNERINEFVPVMEVRGAVCEVKLDLEGKRLCVLGDDKDVAVYNFELKKKLKYENTEVCSMLSCGWSPNGEFLATVSKKGTLALFRLAGNFERLELVQTWRISDKELNNEQLHAMNPVFQ